MAAIPYRLNTQSLKPGIEVTVAVGNSEQKLVIESVKAFKNRLALKLTGIDDESAARNLRGADILLEMDELASLDEGEYYHFQIEGLDVFEENGACLGIVSSIDTTAANDILNIKTENGVILIPFIKSVIVAVDLRGKRVIIRKIEGLY